MDESLEHNKPNPVLTANPISKLFFWWMNPLFRKGYVGQLEAEDMYNVVEEDQSGRLGDQLEKEWAKEVAKEQAGGGKPNLLYALIRMFGLEYILFGLVLMCEETSRLVQPLLLGGLIRYFTPGPEVTKTESLLYAGGVSLCTLILAITHHPYFFGVQRIGMKIRIACSSLLYRKPVSFLHYLWIGPLEAIVVLALLWRELGPSTFAGFAVMLLLIPVQVWMGKLFSRFRQKTAGYTDERVGLMNEIIAGMRLIKMYCWEKPFGDLVKKVRRNEVQVLRKISYLSSSWETVTISGRHLFVFAVVVLLVASREPLRARSLFVVIALFNEIGKIILRFTLPGVRNSIAAQVSLIRIQNFLLLSEHPCTSSPGNDGESVTPADCMVDIDNVSAKWDQEQEQQTLKNVSAKVEPGKLLAVIGPVGAGKSSLLMAILQELPSSQGQITLKGRVAYVSQLPWVFSATLRQNITFGNKYEKAKYDRIIKACALNKARVSLARALYMDADVYLLDDPLSAVDTAVGRHLFENVVQGYLKTKPRILVTHQLQYLKEAEQILIMKEGEMIGRGTFQELSKSGIDFSSLLKHEEDELEEIHSDPGLVGIQAVQRKRSSCTQSKSNSKLSVSDDQHLVADGYNVTNVTIPKVDANFNIAVYSGIMVAMFLFGILRALMFFKITIDASQALHNTMFTSILRSHIGFFDKNPVGRILNRFSKDIGNMDDHLPHTFFDFTQCALLILGVVCVAGAVNPWAFLVVGPLIVLFVFIRRYYIRTSRDIKRLKTFIEEFDAHQDLHTEPLFLSFASSRWLAIRLDWLCFVFASAVSFCCVLTADYLNAGLVGLSMTYAITIMGMFQWGVRQSVEVENQMIAVERVIDYARLPSEAPLEISDDHKPPPSWPQNGAITLKNACLKYSSEEPTVLNNLSFTIKAREKIGIVGRTGAGKSSLITMLFRLVEPTGQIMIDGDPVLFKGSLRRNLDPFGNHSDDALWQAIEEVQLKHAIDELPKGLESSVSEGGVNFSVGQRQLICLARAILGNNKILMIDEATANVLEDGKIEEFDSPYMLLKREDGLLKRLVEQTGRAETARLVEIARTAFETHNNTHVDDESLGANPVVIKRPILEHDVSDEQPTREEQQSASESSDSEDEKQGLLTEAKKD
ncbi:MRP4-like protein [Mya arenaria]|uniref:MRP4-like protein n=1 Tax=Mya arenaria TaxID=6604 RepID=A0ABY7DBJ7_MYAAR|nr:MRP4-like protein [Mya arenaria]